MRRLLITLSLFSFFATYAQDENDIEVTVSYNQTIPIKFNVYEIPLKIKQVSSQAQIDYSKPEGILQSFYSANTKEWAISEYLKKPERMVRDQEHFDAVKKRDIAKNHIQLETVYNFEYNNRQMAFLKYAIIDEHLPFQLLGVLSIEKVKNRWFISQILNQNQVSTLLVNFDNSVLLSFFSKSRNINLDPKIEKSMQINDGQFSFSKADRVFDDLVKQSNKPVLKTLKDKRNVDETYKPPVAVENSKFTEYTFGLAHPFLMDSTRYLKYSPTDSVILKNKENMAIWENKPEALLSKGAAILKLDTKFTFFSNNKTYYIMTYFSSKKGSVVIVKENGVLKKELIAFQDLKMIFQNFKKGVFLELIQSEIENKDLARIKKASSSSDRVLNLSLLIDYLNKNPLDKRLVFE